MLTLASGGTLQGVAQTTGVTATVFGDEIGATDAYKTLAQVTLPTSAGVLYTATNTSTIISEIDLINTNASAVTFTLYINGTGAANQIANLTLPANGMATYTANSGWVLYDSTGKPVLPPFSLVDQFANPLAPGRPAARDKANEQNTPLAANPSMSTAIGTVTAGSTAITTSSAFFTNAMNGLGISDTLGYVLPGTTMTYVSATSATLSQAAIQPTGLVASATNDQFISALTPPAGAVFTGAWTRVDEYQGLVFLWACTVRPASVVQQWSFDGTTVDMEFGPPAPLTLKQTQGYWIALSLPGNTPTAPYYRIVVTNGATNQPGTVGVADSGFPFLIAANWLLNTPWTGSYGGLTDSLSLLSQALLTRSVLAATKPDGSFGNVAATGLGSLQVAVESAPATASGSLFTESIRDDVSINFANANSLSFIEDGGSVNGTATLDSTNGQVVFDTTATAGSSVIYQSVNDTTYEPGHTIRAEQTIQINALPTGNAYIEWGLGDPVNNGIGYRLTAAGLFTFRRKNGTLFTTAQSAWNRDSCNGGQYSQFIHNGFPQALNVLFDNLYQVDFEWLGAAPISFTLKSPNGNRVLANVIEYPNNNLGSTVPNPALPVYVAAFNDTVAGGSVQVRCGSWRGGILTSKVSVTGLNPGQTYSNVLIQGIDPNNSTTALLNANATFRGTWFQWASGYVEAAINMFADQAGTLFIDFSNTPTPVNGSDVSVNDSISYSYNPVTEPFLRAQAPLQSQWYRVRYVNGVAAQASFSLQSILSTEDVGTTSTTLKHLPTTDSMASLTQSIDLVDNGQGIGVYHQLPVDSSGFPAEHIVAFDPSIFLAALNTWTVVQTTVGTSASRLDITVLPDRRSITIVNQSATTPMYIGQNNSVTSVSGELISPLGSSTMQLGPGGQVWGTCAPGGTQTVYQRAGSSASGTATTPSGALGTSGSPTGTPGSGASAANGQTIVTSGYTAATSNPIVKVRLGLSGHKATSPTSETIGFIDVVTGVAGNTGSVVSASVTANAAHFYVVEISRRNTTATVTGVTGMGLTWTLYKTIVGGQQTVDIWYATGVGATSGAVTATFSATATDSVIAVSRYSNVNFSSPFTDFTLLQANSGTIAGSVACNAGGMVLVATGAVNRTISSVTGSLTYTVQNDTGSGGQAEAGTITGPSPSTATATFSVTLSGAAPYAAVGLSLNPNPTIQPQVLLSYSVTAGPGATSGTVTLPSTTDSTQYVDITSDQGWTPTLVSQITYTSTTTTGAAAALIDFQFVEITDSTGNVATVAVKQMAP